MIKPPVTEVQSDKVCKLGMDDDTVPNSARSSQTSTQAEGAKRNQLKIKMSSQSLKRRESDM